MKNFLIVTLGILTFLFSLSLCLAQEGEMDYSWGVVVKVSPEEIIVLEYDYELEKETKVAYKIDRETEFIDIESIDDLIEDDPVEISYIVKNNERIIKTITLEDTSDGEGYGPEETEYLPEELEEEDIKY